MKKLIVVLIGGLSREREISFQTGNACFKSLKKNLPIVTIIFVINIIFLIIY